MDFYSFGAPSPYPLPHSQERGPDHDLGDKTCRFSWLYKREKRPLRVKDVGNDKLSEVGWGSDHPA
jgi:hypothetical protein